MGGKGSGGGNRLSDDEKKKRGTFEPAQSDAVYDAQAAAKVLQGPWLTKVPAPDFPLAGVGLARYEELAKQILDQGKLTAFVVTRASIAGLLHQKFHNLAAAGKSPTANDVGKYQSVLRDLEVVSNAKALPAPGKTERFTGAGFANRRSTPFRLQPAASPARK